MSDLSEKSINAIEHKVKELLFSSVDYESCDIILAGLSAMIASGGKCVKDIVSQVVVNNFHMNFRLSYGSKNYERMDCICFMLSELQVKHEVLSNFEMNQLLFSCFGVSSLTELNMLHEYSQSGTGFHRLLSAAKPGNSFFAIAVASGNRHLLLAYKHIDPIDLEVSYLDEGFLSCSGEEYEVPIFKMAKNPLIFEMAREFNVTCQSDEHREGFNAHFGPHCFPWLYEARREQECEYKAPRLPIIQDGKLHHPELALGMFGALNTPLLKAYISKIPCFVPKEEASRFSDVVFLPKRKPSTIESAFELGYEPQGQLSEELAKGQAGLVASMLPKHRLLSLDCPEGHVLVMASLDALSDLEIMEVDQGELELASQYSERLASNGSPQAAYLGGTALYLGVCYPNGKVTNGSASLEAVFKHIRHGGDVEPLKDIVGSGKEYGSNATWLAISHALGRDIRPSKIRVMGSPGHQKDVVDYLFENNVSLKGVELLFGQGQPKQAGSSKERSYAGLNMETMAKLIQLDCWPFDEKRPALLSHALDALPTTMISPKGGEYIPEAPFHIACYLTACGPEILIPHCKHSHQLKGLSLIFGESRFNEELKKASKSNMPEQALKLVRKHVISSDFQI